MFARNHLAAESRKDLFKTDQSVWAKNYNPRCPRCPSHPDAVSLAAQLLQQHLHAGDVAVPHEDAVLPLRISSCGNKQAEDAAASAAR